MQDEWDRRLSQARRPAWAVQRLQFIKRRLAQPNFSIRVWLHHRASSDCSLIVAEVPLHQAGISRRKLLHLFPYLQNRDWAQVDCWGEVLVKFHLQDFERGVAGIQPEQWARALSESPLQQHYGLMLVNDPPRLLFSLYPERVADAINQSLILAALEAKV